MNSLAVIIMIANFLCAFLIIVFGGWPLVALLNAGVGIGMGIVLLLVSKERV